MNRVSVPPAAIVGALLLSPLLALIAAALGEQAVVAAVAALIGIALCVAVFVQPFIGVALLILFSQTDALLAVIVGELPAMKLLTALTLGAAIVDAGFRKRGIGVRLDPSIAFAVLLLLALFASALYASDHGRAFHGVRRLASMIVLFFLVALLVDSERKVRIALVCILASTIVSGAVIVIDSQIGASVIAAQAVVEAGGDEFRSRGTTQGDATTAASILLAGSAVGAVIALRSRGGFRSLAVAAAIIGVLGILFSFTRSATLALGIGAIWLAWRNRHNPTVLASVALSLAVLAVLLPGALAERMASILGQGYDFTLLRRLGYHLIGIQLFFERPLLGIGPANFAHYYTDFQYRWIPGRTLTPRLMHNMYLAITVELGILGACAFFGLLASSYVRCLRAIRAARSRALATYAEATLFGFALLLLVSATLPNETNKYVWIYAGLAVAIARAAARERDVWAPEPRFGTAR